MEYAKYLGDIASVITIIGAVFIIPRWLFKYMKSVSEELWENSYPWRIKDYISPPYVIDGWDKKKGKIDKQLSKLLMHNHRAPIVLLVGESGVGKSFLCVKVYHRLIFRTVMRRYHLKYVNAARLDNFSELENNPNAEKTILFLDGLDEYHLFLESKDLETTKEIYYKLQKVLNMYGRVVITARSSYYAANKEHVDWVCYQLAGCDKNKVVKVTLTGMEDQQIRKYLKRNLKLKDDKIEKCIHLVHSSREILSRPIFLQFLEGLPEDISYSNSYRVYEEIVKSWIEWEQDKAVSPSNPIAKADLGGLFNKLTERYILNLPAKRATVYFQPEEILDLQLGIDNSVLGSRALLKYDSKYGFYCIHHSFFEFNYVRLHYREMCRKGMKEKKFMYESLQTFYEECHYNRTFAPDFPQAEVILLKSGKKLLSELIPSEAGRIIQIRILKAEDLMHSEFRKFIQGVYHSSFMLGPWKVNNVQLRLLLQNNYLNLSEWKIQSAGELDWFQGFPVYALNLSHTGIRTLGFLDNFPLLERLVSVGNPLESVGEVGKCENLSYINFSNCGLTSFAMGIRWPDSLRKLIASNNEIFDLAFLSHMHLEELDISDNPLQSRAESFMEIPNKVRCVYHFASDALKDKILNGKQTADMEIQYGEVMSFLENNDGRVRLDDNITSVFGLENVYCKNILIPLGLIPLLNALSRPLHTEDVAILSEQGYKLGYELNDLFSMIDSCSGYRLTLAHAINLCRQCGRLLNCLVDYEDREGGRSVRCNNALKGIMDTQTFQLCLEEVYLIACICLKYIRQRGANKEKDTMSLAIVELAQDYGSRHLVPDYLWPNNLKYLSEQHKKFSEKGKEFKRAISIIQSNTTGSVKIIWSVNNRYHTEFRIVHNSDDGSVSDEGERSL